MLGLLVSSWLLVVKFWGSQELYAGFSDCAGHGTPDLHDPGSVVHTGGACEGSRGSEPGHHMGLSFGRRLRCRRKVIALVVFIAA